jgi:hypothetical protein
MEQMSIANVMVCLDSAPWLPLLYARTYMLARMLAKSCLQLVPAAAQPLAVNLLTF